MAVEPKARSPPVLPCPGLGRFSPDLLSPLAMAREGGEARSTPGALRLCSYKQAKPFRINARFYWRPLERFHLLGYGMG